MSNDDNDAHSIVLGQILLSDTEMTIVNIMVITYLFIVDVVITTYEYLHFMCANWTLFLIRFLKYNTYLDFGYIFMPNNNYGLVCF